MKKTTKILAAVLVALVILASTCTTAFAAETINNVHVYEVSMGREIESGTFYKCTNPEGKLFFRDSSGYARKTSWFYDGTNWYYSGADLFLQKTGTVCCGSWYAKLDNYVWDGVKRDAAGNQIQTRQPASYGPAGYSGPASSCSCPTTYGPGARISKIVDGSNVCFRYDNGTGVPNQWVISENYTYRTDSAGKAMTGSFQVGDYWYYGETTDSATFPKGATIRGMVWHNFGGITKWAAYDNDGHAIYNQTVKFPDGNYYSFGNDGYARTGWYGGNYYSTDASCGYPVCAKVISGWVLDNGYWYYLKDGAKVTDRYIWTASDGTTKITSYRPSSAPYYYVSWTGKWTE